MYTKYILYILVITIFTLLRYGNQLRVSMSGTHQTLQPLCHDGCKSSLAGQFGDEEDVLRCCDLIGTMSTT